MRRRDFIGLAGSALAGWPLAEGAQQPAVPVIGFLHLASPETFAVRLRGFRRGLKEIGFVEGDNVAIEYRWADNQSDRLPELAADLIRQNADIGEAVGKGSSVPEAAVKQSRQDSLLFDHLVCAGKQR
jgi:ABC-type sugar transport system substrate-binding protein